MSKKMSRFLAMVLSIVMLASMMPADLALATSSTPYNVGSVSDPDQQGTGTAANTNEGSGTAQPPALLASLAPGVIDMGNFGLFKDAKELAQPPYNLIRVDAEGNIVYSNGQYTLFDGMKYLSVDPSLTVETTPSEPTTELTPVAPITPVTPTDNTPVTQSGSDEGSFGMQSKDLGTDRYIDEGVTAPDADCTNLDELVPIESVYPDAAAQGFTHCYLWQRNGVIVTNGDNALVYNIYGMLVGYWGTRPDSESTDSEVIYYTSDSDLTRQEMTEMEIAGLGDDGNPYYRVRTNADGSTFREGTNGSDAYFSAAGALAGEGVSITPIESLISPTSEESANPPVGAVTTVRKVWMGVVQSEIGSCIVPYVINGVSEDGLHTATPSGSLIFPDKSQYSSDGNGSWFYDYPVAFLWNDFVEEGITYKVTGIKFQNEITSGEFLYTRNADSTVEYVNTVVRKFQFKKVWTSPLKGSDYQSVEFNLLLNDVVSDKLSIPNNSDSWVLEKTLKMATGSGVTWVPAIYTIEETGVTMSNGTAVTPMPAEIGSSINTYTYSTYTEIVITNTRIQNPEKEAKVTVTKLWDKMTRAEWSKAHPEDVLPTSVSIALYGHLKNQTGNNAMTYITLATIQTPLDVAEFIVDKGKYDRYTFVETGMVPAATISNWTAEVIDVVVDEDGNATGIVNNKSKPTTDTGKFKGNKIWREDGYADEDAIIPGAQISIQLLYKGQPEGDPKPLQSSTLAYWPFEFDVLHPDEMANYSIVEIWTNPDPSYVTYYEGNNVINDHITDWGGGGDINDVVIRKVWGVNNIDVPAMTLTVSRRKKETSANWTEVGSITIPAGKTGPYVGSFEEDPKRDAGVLYEYKLEETVDSGTDNPWIMRYSVVQSGDHVLIVATNTLNETVDVPFKKTWKMSVRFAPQADLVPDKTAIYELWRTNEDSPPEKIREMELSGDVPMAAFEGLPKYSATGYEYQYEVREVKSGFATVIKLVNGVYEITNTQLTTEITALKTWALSQGQDLATLLRSIDGVTGVSFRLYYETSNGFVPVDGVSPVTFTIEELAREPSQTISFEGLPKYDKAGNLINYQIREEQIGDGTVFVPSDPVRIGDTWQITNSYVTDATVTLSVSKAFQGETDADKSKRPVAIQFVVYNHTTNPTHEYDKRVTVDGADVFEIRPTDKNADDQWKKQLKGLAKTVEVGGQNVTIQYWVEEIAMDYGNGWVSVDDDQNYLFMGIDEYPKNAFKIMNKLKTSMTENDTRKIRVYKEWDEADLDSSNLTDAEKAAIKQAARNSIQFYLDWVYGGTPHSDSGNPSVGPRSSVGEHGKESVVFTVPMLNADGGKVTYVPSEDVPTGYVGQLTQDFLFGTNEVYCVYTNTYTTDLIQAKVQKTWNVDPTVMDVADQPTELVVWIRDAKDENGTSRMVRLNQANEWTAVVDLPRVYPNDTNPIEYQAIEYSVTINGITYLFGDANCPVTPRAGDPVVIKNEGEYQYTFNFHNELQNSIGFDGTKTWKGLTNSTDNYPKSLQVQLYRKKLGTTETEDQQIGTPMPVSAPSPASFTGTDGNYQWIWRYTFERIPKYVKVDGKWYKAEYYVKEIAPVGFTEQSGSESALNNAQNTFSIKGKKDWKPDELAGKINYPSVTFDLYRRKSASDQWGSAITSDTIFEMDATSGKTEFSFHNLLTHWYDENGEQPYQYRIVERRPAGFGSVVTTTYDISKVQSGNTITVNDVLGNVNEGVTITATTNQGDVTGILCVNTIPTQSLALTKEWLGDELLNWEKSFTVTLKAYELNGSEITALQKMETFTRVGDPSNSWTFEQAFTGLPTHYWDGSAFQTITYKIVETSIPGYALKNAAQGTMDTVGVTGASGKYTATLQNEFSTEDLIGGKSWAYGGGKSLNGDASVALPGSIQITLKRYKAGQTVADGEPVPATDILSAKINGISVADPSQIEWPIPVSLSADGTASWEFHGMPSVEITEEGGKLQIGDAYTYFVKEEALANVVTTESKGSLTNTLPLIDLKLIKAWAGDDGDKYKTRKDVTFVVTSTPAVFKSGNGVVATKEYPLTQNNLQTNGNWEISLANMPEYVWDNGAFVKVAYSVTEKTAIAGYTPNPAIGTNVSLVLDLSDEIYKATITNTMTPEGFTVTKHWDYVPGTLPDTLMRAPVTLKLYSSTDGGATLNPVLAWVGNVSTQVQTTLYGTENPAWTWTLTGLPPVNSEGVEYAYYAKEEPALDDSAYEASAYSENTKTKNEEKTSAGHGEYVWNTPKLMNISITKIWDDSAVANPPRPEKIVVTLKAMVGTTPADVFPGASIGAWQNTKELILIPDDADGFTWTFASAATGLPEYVWTGEQFEEVTYTWAETLVPGYGTEAPSGTVAENGNIEITNSMTPLDESGEKRWQFEAAGELRADVNAQVLYPASIEITLMRESSAVPNGEKVPANEILTTFPARQDEKDRNPLTILANEADVDGVWKWSFNGLPPVDADGNPYTYYVEETAIDDDAYQEPGPGKDGETKIITNTANLTNLKLTKIWDDNGNKYNTRPTSITVTLTSNYPVFKVNDKPSNTLVVPLNSGNVDPDDPDQWIYEMINLPKYAWTDTGFALVTYKATEAAIPNYTTTYANKSTDTDGTLSYDATNNVFSVTITNKLPTVGLKGEKYWNFDGVGKDVDQTGLYPTSIELTLKRTNPNDPIDTEPETVLRSDGIGGFEKYVLPVYVDKAGKWTWTIPKELPQYDAEDGGEYVYFVVETRVDANAYGAPEYSGNKTEVDDEKIGAENDEFVWNTPELINIDVAKYWLGDDGFEAGTRPEEITVMLSSVPNVFGMVDTTPIKLKRTLDEENSWHNSFNGLPKYWWDGDEFVKIVYTITEIAVTGYSTTYTVDGITGRDVDTAEPAEEGNTYYVEITNEMEDTYITGTKDWDTSTFNGVIDEEFLEMYDKGSITVWLWRELENGTTEQVEDANGPISQTVDANSNPEWTWSFSGLPVWQPDATGEGGFAYVYFVTEEEPANYTGFYDNDGEYDGDYEGAGDPVEEVRAYDGATITNVADTTKIEGTKTWNLLETEANVELPEYIFITVIGDTGDEDDEPFPATTFKVELEPDEITTDPYDFTWKIDGLPMCAPGTDHAYEWETAEIQVPGFDEPVEDGQDIVNTLTVEDFGGEKTWIHPETWTDAEIAGVQPQLLNIYLYSTTDATILDDLDTWLAGNTGDPVMTLADPTEQLMRTVGPNSWTWEFDNLPANKLTITDGVVTKSEPLYYFVREEAALSGEVQYSLLGYVESNLKPDGETSDPMYKTNEAITGDLRIIKAWYDTHDASGERAKIGSIEIVVTGICSDDTKIVRTITLDKGDTYDPAGADDNADYWSAVIEDLPVYDNTGAAIIYTAAETDSPLSSYDGASISPANGIKLNEELASESDEFVIRVTNTVRDGNLKVDKDYDGEASEDYNYARFTRPLELTYHLYQLAWYPNAITAPTVDDVVAGTLYRTEKKTVVPADITVGAVDWGVMFNNLPVSTRINGDDWTYYYYVVEHVDGDFAYDWSVTKGGVFTVNEEDLSVPQYEITNKLKTVDIDVVKNWENNEAYGKDARADVEVTLYSYPDVFGGTQPTRMLTESNHWTQSFTGLPEYAYEVIEGERSEEPIKVTYWVNEESADYYYHSTSGAMDPYTIHTTDDLQEGYLTFSEGTYTMTFTNVFDTIDIDVDKVYLNDERFPDQRGEITVQLMRSWGDEPGNSEPAHVDENGVPVPDTFLWSDGISYTGLAKGKAIRDEGALVFKPYTYYLVEVDPVTYERVDENVVTINPSGESEYGLTLENDLIETELVIYKEWDDDFLDVHNAFKLRPETLTFTIYRDGAPYMTVDADGNVTAVPHTEDMDVDHPASGVYAAAEANELRIKGLPKYKYREGQGNDVEFQYSVVETPVFGYLAPEYVPAQAPRTANEDNEWVYTVTNRLDRINIRIVKLWDDKDNEHYRPELNDGVWFMLEAIDSEGDAAFDTRWFRVNSQDTATRFRQMWEQTFYGLPRNDRYGEPITYKLTEVNRENGDTTPVSYTIEYEGGQEITINADESLFSKTLTNTLKTIEIDVKKVWEDRDNENKVRPDSLVVELLADEKSFTPAKTVTLNSANNWSAKFGRYPVMNNDGVKIEYSVRETVPTGYRLQSSASLSMPTVDTDEQKTFTLTNTPIVKSLTITKRWEDGTYGSTYRPESGKLVFQLTASVGTTPLFQKLYEMNYALEGAWTMTIPNLPVYDKDGNIINYRVQEGIYGVEAYIASYSPAGGAINPTSATATANMEVTVTNTLSFTQVRVTKAWTGLASVATAPAVVIELLADGQVIETRTFGPATAFSYTFENLPLKNKTGKNVIYDARETTTLSGNYRYVGITRATTTGYAADITVTNNYSVVAGETTTTETNTNTNTTTNTGTVGGETIAKFTDENIPLAGGTGDLLHLGDCFD